MELSQSSLIQNLRRQRPEVWLNLLAVYFIWGSTYLALRFALESFPPFMLVGTRFIVAGGLMLGWLRWRGEPMPTRQEWLHAGIVGLLLLGVGNGGVTFAEQWVSSALAAAVIATAPLWTALFSGLFGHWPTRREWLGIALGLVGVILLNLEGELRAAPLGAMALVLAPIGWSFGSVLSRYKLKLPNGPMGSAAEMLVGGIGLSLVSASLGEQMRPLTLPAVSAWLYLIVFGSLVAFTAYMFLIRTVRPSLALSYAYVNPVVALGLGLLFADGTITLFGLLGLGIILAGVVVITLARSTSSS
ncbi:MAG: drug/metabolite exporter YedA [Anaerolineales bacterium]|nr:drug/metabolite exporter YedA [Anaerolineales bacterium]